MRKTTSRKPRAARVPAKRPCDKWIVGMVQQLATEPTLQMFKNPTPYDSYATAVRIAEESYRIHGKPFVVFAKVCVIGPSRPPVLKTEFST